MPLNTGRRAAVLSLILIGLCPVVRAQFTQDQINALRHSVVRVDAHQCSGVPGGYKYGSGFFWKQNSSVVTTLHVVNGCTALSVYSDTGSNPQKPSVIAQVQKILFDEDLVLLSLDDTIDGTTVVSESKPAPSDTRDILLVGFPEDGHGSTAKAIKRQFSGNTLATLASSQARTELQRSNSPSLTTVVIFLQAIIEHGGSGGPIFNQQGAVVAVADGGLKHGLTEDSWAIPAEDLAALESSSDPLTKMPQQQSTLLFAATPVASQGPTVQCGGGSFKHTKTVSYSDVLLTADDPHGLQQLVAVSRVDPSTLAFEVYQDDQTGATVALPESEMLTANANNDTCIARSSGGGVITVVKAIDTSNDLTGRSAAVKFETQIMGLNLTWVEVPAFSYLQPIPVAGGALSQRRDWVRYVPFPGTMQLNFQQYDAQQFETLALRGKILLGVVAQNIRWNPQIVATQQSCAVNPNASPVCPQALQDLRDWITSTLAVHLSTMAGT